jgi:arylsulfatase A-like enzyme
VVFEDATATAAWTLPSHMSMLTGLYPVRHKVTGFRSALPESTPTLARMLAKAGWKTGAVVNVEWLRKETYRVTRDFELYSWAPATLDRRSANSWVTDQAIDWIAAAGDRPLLVFAHYYDVHTDYKAEEAYEKLFLTPYEGVADGTAWQLKRVVLPEEYIAYCRTHDESERCRFGPDFELNETTEKLAFTEADVRRTRELYDAQIRQLDAELARLFTSLRKQGLFDETLVIVTSDHGEEFMEHGSMEHFYTAYQEIARVPLILRGPGLPRGMRVDVPVSLVDLVPTILQRVGVSSPAGLDGLDLSPLWAGGDAASVASFENRMLYLEAPGGEAHNLMIGDYFPVYRAIRKGPYKLVVEAISNTHALYDLEEDPGEQVDVSGQHPELVAELLAVAAERSAEAAGAETEDAVELDAESLERLRALGYVP